MWKTSLALGVLLAFTGCDDDEPAPTLTTTPEVVPAAGGTTSETPPPEAAETAEPVAEEAPAVDLLHAVATTVSTSTAFDFDREQIERLYDGDLETVWNSESNALTDAFVEVEVPEDAEVTGIEMTAGYTKSVGDRDLFTMNHRVARVRVTQGSTVLAEQALDVDDRELQMIPFEATGGILRIELAELTEGSNAEFREACLSELRVMGRAPSATGDRTEPEVEIGPIGGLARNDALEELTRLRAEHEANPEEGPQGPLLRAQHAYARAWVAEAFDCHTMPRLEEGWASVAHRRSRLVDQYAMFERRVTRLTTRVETGEATAGEERRLERMSSRLEGLLDPLDRTEGQASDLIDQIDRFMNDECLEIMNTLESPL